MDDVDRSLEREGSPYRFSGLELVPISATSLAASGNRQVRVKMRLRRIAIKFERACILFINLSARMFGAMAPVVGIFFLVSAYAFEANRATYAVAGIFAVAVGAAVFMAKPITAEVIARIRRRIGDPE